MGNDRVSDEEELRGIRDVANSPGVTTRTLRFYEDRGLIEPRRVGTARVYSKRETGRMQLILRGKRLGFSLREIEEFCGSTTPILSMSNRCACWPSDAASVSTSYASK